MFNGKPRPAYQPVARYRLAETNVRVWRCTVARLPGSFGGAGRFVALTSGRLPDGEDYRHETEEAAARHHLGEKVSDARRSEF